MMQRCITKFTHVFYRCLKMHQYKFFTIKEKKTLYTLMKYQSIDINLRPYESHFRD